MKINFQRLLTIVAIASLTTLHATKGFKKIKCLRVNQLTVCNNEEIAGNLIVHGNTVIDGTLTVDGTVITPAPASVVAYGSFYSNANLTLPSAITLTAGVNFPAGAFTPFNNGTGTGVTVANAGTYLVWFSVLGFNDVVQWQLNNPAGLIPGSNVDNGTDNTFANGFAAVTVAAGDFIIITNTDNDTTGTASDGSNTVLLTLLRVR